MKQQTDYEAICCNEPMVNMNLWPHKVHLAKWDKHEDGSMTSDFGEVSDAYCHTFHCHICDCYIGIAWHQPAKEK